MTKTIAKHPDSTLEDGLRERGVIVRVMWEMKGPKDTQIAWLQLLGVGSKCRLFIVETYKDGGWEVFIQSREGKITECIDEVARVCEES